MKVLKDIGLGVKRLRSWFAKTKAGKWFAKTDWQRLVVFFLAVVLVATAMWIAFRFTPEDYLMQENRRLEEENSELYIAWAASDNQLNKLQEERQAAISDNTDAWQRVAGMQTQLAAVEEELKRFRQQPAISSTPPPLVAGDPVSASQMLEQVKVVFPTASVWWVRKGSGELYSSATFDQLVSEARGTSSLWGSWAKMLVLREKYGLNRAPFIGLNPRSVPTLSPIWGIMCKEGMIMLAPGKESQLLNPEIKSQLKVLNDMEKLISDSIVVEVQ